MRNLWREFKSDRGESDAGGGIGLGGAVFLVFLVLKLTGYIGWSWWWVFSPLWLPLLIVLAIWLIIVVVAAIISLFD